LAAGCLLACEPAEDVEPLACENPVPGVGEVGLGNLESGFLELADGADVQVVLGPQGLHMITISARIEHFERPSQGGGRALVTAATRVGGAVVGGNIAHLIPEAAGEDMVEFVGVRSIFTAEVEAFVGQVADIVLTAHDGCGRKITATRKARLIQ